MSLKNKKILLVDEDLSFCKIIERILTVQGMVVLVATDLEGALKAVEENHPHGIIINPKLTDTEGKTLLELRPQSGLLLQIPTFVICDENNTVSVKSAVALGATDYILRPLKQTALLQKLRKHLMQHKTLSYQFNENQRPTPKIIVSCKAQLLGISETHAHIRSPFKVPRGKKVEVKAKLFEKKGLPPIEMRVQDESTASEKGLYDTYLALLGMVEKTAAKIREAKFGWRTK